MSKREPFLRRRARFGLFLAALSLAFSCQSATEAEPTGGETHFLKRCEPTSAPCGSGLACVCEVCTLPCSQASACEAFPGAACVTTAGADACGDPSGPAHCDVPCSLDAECSALSSSHVCVRGACRNGALTCTHGEVTANQVLLLGDSFIAYNHQITAYLEDLARTAGVLSPGERYRDNSSSAFNGLALGGNGIANQYDVAIEEAEVRVVIMNGGGADLLVGSCEPADAECPVIVEAAAAARALFSKMAEDGVRHVIYAFYPDPVDAQVRAEIDALRPVIQSACASSPVPCHWLDLRATFAGHYGEYVQEDGLNPTAAGAQATARAVWATMQRECIAQ